MGDLPTKSSQFIPIIVVAVLSLVAYTLPTYVTEYLDFTRQGIAQHQWWRLLSAHFLHTNTYHLAVNLAGLFLLWLLHGEYYRARNYSAVFVITSLFVSILVWLASPHLNAYVGLSGVLHGVFAWGIIQDFKHKRVSAYLLLAGLIIKLIDERFFSTNDFMANLIGASVAIDAHLYGAIAGIMLGVLLPSVRLHKPSTI